MITTLSNFTRSILNINSNRIRNKWSSPVCAIPRLIPRFHFPTRAIPIIVAAVERDNVDSETELWSSRVPSFRLSYRSVKRVQPRFEGENSLFKLVEIFTFPELFDFSHESCTTILTYVFYLVKVIVIIWNNE